MKTFKIKYKNILFILFVITAIFLSIIFFKKNKDRVFKVSQPTNSKLTIYKKNINSQYPKTKIKIPSHEGYLIAVFKDEHKLKLYQSGVIIKEYDVNIKRELPDRKKWDDDQTPEGVFVVDSLNIVTDPAWSRWIRFDTSEKAREIYKQEHADGAELIREFEDRYERLDNDKAIRQFNKLHPNKNMLRGFGIHGGGFSLYNEWTLGCVAMEDRDVIELYDFLITDQNGGLGIKVIIQD